MNPGSTAAAGRGFGEGLSIAQHPLSQSLSPGDQSNPTTLEQDEKHRGAPGSVLLVPTASPASKPQLWRRTRKPLSGLGGEMPPRSALAGCSGRVLRSGDRLGAQILSFPPSCMRCGDKSGLSGYPLWASHTQPGSQDEGSFLSGILALKGTGTPLASS